MIDHTFDTYNFTDRAVYFNYEFKQYLTEYNVKIAKAGITINEAKEIDTGALEAYDKNHNSDYHLYVT